MLQQLNRCLAIIVVLFSTSLFAQFPEPGGSGGSGGSGGGGGTYTAGPSGALVLTGSAFDIDTAYVPGKTLPAAITGPWTFANATSTAPFKVGTTLPATCVTGEGFFDSDATAGQNIYGCTATNTWTLQSGAGGTYYIAIPFWTASTATPLNATTYYAGCVAKGFETAASAQDGPCYVPIASTLVAVYMGTHQFGAGSSEPSTVYIRQNDTTDTTVCTTLDNSTARSVCNGTGLSVAYSAGDYFKIKWVTPTWGTNPTTLTASGVAVFEVAGGGGGGGGTVTTASVVTANGFAGTVATATTTPAITLTTSVTGMLKGNGTAISAASAGTDYVVPAGNVATATALAADPTDCSTNQPALGIAAAGTAACMTLTATVVKSASGVLSAATAGTDYVDVGTANSWGDGIKQTFNPSATTSGFNVGSVAGDPSAPANGDIWYDSTANELTARINGASVALGAGGGGSGTVTSVGWTGGIVSIATATTTPAFTIAGTSGGIPYFSSASTWASSAALTTGAIVFGGGAGVAPTIDATNLFWDNSNKRLGIGTNAPATQFHVEGASAGISLHRNAGNEPFIRLATTGSISTTGGQVRGADSALGIKLTHPGGVINWLMANDNGVSVGQTAEAPGTGMSFSVFDDTATIGATRSQIQEGVAQSTTAGFQYRTYNAALGSGTLKWSIASGGIPTWGSTTEATCNSGTRGQVVMVQGGAGVADTYRICAKNAADAYNWTALF